jgi:hypothetical protein
MRKDLLIIALGLSLASGSATADVLATPEADPAIAAQAPPALPTKGITMAAVEKKFGSPMHRRPTVGGDSPKHPPITRWDYDGFSVIFENDKVIDAVIPGAPPRVYHKDQLTPVAASAAPPPPVPAAKAELAPPPAEEPIIPPPADSEAVPEAPAEEAAASAPASTLTPAESAPAESTPPPAESTPPPEQTAPSSYPDAPAASSTPAEEAPADTPPTPK